ARREFGADGEDFCFHAMTRKPAGEVLRTCAGLDCITHAGSEYLTCGFAGHCMSGSWRQHDVEVADLVRAVLVADLPQLDDERLADELIIALVRVAAEVELRDEFAVVLLAHPVMDVRRPPGVGADTIGARVDR